MGGHDEKGHKQSIQINGPTAGGKRNYERGGGPPQVAQQKGFLTQGHGKQKTYGERTQPNRGV